MQTINTQPMEHLQPADSNDVQKAAFAARQAIEETSSEAILAGWRLGAMRYAIRAQLESKEPEKQIQGRRDFFELVVPGLENALNTGNYGYLQMIAATDDANLTFIRGLQKKGSIAALKSLGLEIPASSALVHLLTQTARSPAAVTRNK